MRGTAVRRQLWRTNRLWLAADSWMQQLLVFAQLVLEWRYSDYIILKSYYTNVLKLLLWGGSGELTGCDFQTEQERFGILLENVYLSLLILFSDVMVTNNACHEMSEFYISILAFQLLEIYLQATFVKWWIAAIKGFKGYIQKIVYFLEWWCLCEILLQMNVGDSIIITTVLITQHKLIIFLWMNNKQIFCPH